MPSPAQRRQWSKRGFRRPDAGTTMIELARQITHLPLRVITSDRISRFLAEFKQIEVTIIGGRIDDSSQSCIGEHGRKLLQNTGRTWHFKL